VEERRVPRSADSALPLGLTAIVLGAVALGLFILPILAVPIAGCGLALGMAGLLGAIVRGTGDLRLALAGVAVCGCAVGVGAAIDLAPGGYFRFPAEPAPTTLQRPRPYVAPPAPARS
jgi:hypothetical protein